MSDHETELAFPEVKPLATPPLSTPWVPIWPLTPSTLGELAYVESLSGNISVSAADTIIVTAPPLTFDGATAILVEFFSNIVQPAVSANAYVGLNLWDGAASFRQMGVVGTPATGQMYSAFAGRLRLTPSAGSHTFSIRATPVGGNGIVGPPFSLRISLASPIVTAPAGASLPVSYGPNLPISPVDGQEHILVNNVNDPAWQWRFRYNAGSASPYKWEFVGGAPKFAREDADPGSLTNTVPVSITPAVSVPRAGDYSIAYGALQQSFHTSGIDMYLNLTDGATESPVPLRWIATTTYNGGPMATTEKRPGVAAGVSFQMRHWGSSNGPRALTCRWLEVCPVRVS